ncbi:MAG: Csu type fimbrial protein [Ardenticatenaceae bacterium]
MILSHRARLLLGTIGALGLALAAPSAAAQDGTIQVSAEVQAACSVVGGGPALVFGIYDSSGPDTLGDTSFDIECSATTDVVVSLDGGNNDNGVDRRMTNGNATDPLLTYQLWQDSARQIKFGDSSGVFGAPTTVNVTNGAGTPVQVFGSILTGQPVPAGLYEDIVGITLTIS